MPLDNAQFISELSITDPPGTDPVSEGDDQIRTTKRATQQSFPFIDAAVTITAAQMNQMAIKNEANTFTGINDFTNFTRFANGSFASPAIGPISDATTGLLWSAGFVGVSLSGISRLSLTAAIMEVGSNQQQNQLGSAAAPSYSFVTNVATGMYSTADVLLFATAGVERLRLSASQARFAMPIYANSGSAAAPGYAFLSDVNMGMYRSASNVLNFATAGVDRIALTGSEINLKSTQVWAAPGSALAPAYAFASNPTMGMFNAGSGALGFATTGATRVTVNPTGSRWNFHQDGPTGGVSLSFVNSAGIVAWSIDYEGTAGFQPKQWSFTRFNSVTGAFINIPLYIDVNGRVHTAQPILTP